MQGVFKRFSGEHDEMPALVHLQRCCTDLHEGEHCMQGFGRPTPQQRSARDMCKGRSRRSQQQSARDMCKVHLATWPTTQLQW